MQPREAVLPAVRDASNQPALFSDAELAQIRVRAEKDLHFFGRFVLGDAIFNGSASDVECPFHRRIAAFLGDESTGRLKVLVAPRGHLKTTWIICRIVQKLAQDRERRILFLQGVEKTAKHVQRVVRQIMEGRRMLHALWPDVFYQNPRKESPLWTAEALQVRSDVIRTDPSILMTSANATVTSLHFTDIYDDDLVNEDNCNTPEMLEKPKQQFRHQENLLVGEECARCWSDTIYDPNDATCWLLDGGDDGEIQVDPLVLGCYEADGATPVWPLRRGAAFLERKRANMGARMFAMQFLATRRIPGATVFDAELVDRVRLPIGPKHSEDWILPGSERFNEGTAAQRTYAVYTAVDPNTEPTTAYDPACVMTAAIDHLGDAWLLDLRLWHPTVVDLIEEMFRQAVKWRPRRMYYEAVQAQKWLAQLVKPVEEERGVKLPIWPLKRGSTKKYTRITSTVPLVERGGLHVPIGSKFDPFVEQMRTYTKAAKNDDALDAFADIVREGVAPAPPDAETRAARSAAFLPQLAILTREEAARSRSAFMSYGPLRPV